MMPTGFGNDTNHWAKCVAPRPTLTDRPPAAATGRRGTRRPLLDQLGEPRSRVPPTRSSVENPQNAKCRNPRSRRCCAPSWPMPWSSDRIPRQIASSLSPSLSSTAGIPDSATAVAICGVVLRTMIPSHGQSSWQDHDGVARPRGSSKMRPRMRGYRHNGGFRPRCRGRRQRKSR